jgi:hypothetical protein
MRRIDRTLLRVLLLSIPALLAAGGIASSAQTLPAGISIRPRARYYAQQTVYLDSLPACLLLVRNKGKETVRFRGAEGGRLLVDLKRYWHGEERRWVTPFYRADNSVVSLAPGDSVVVEALFTELETDTFQVGLSPLPVAGDSAVTAWSGKIALFEAPYMKPLSKGEAAFTLHRRFPAAAITSRHVILAFDLRAGWVWQVEFLLDGKQRARARVDALTGEVLPDAPR